MRGHWRWQKIRTHQDLTRFVERFHITDACFEGLCLEVAREKSVVKEKNLRRGWHGVWGLGFGFGVGIEGEQDTAVKWRKCWGMFRGLSLLLSYLIRFFSIRIL